MYDKLCRQLRAMASTWGISLPREAADAIEELSGLCASQSRYCSEVIAKYLELWTKHPRWIPVAERLPDKPGIYAVWTAKGFGNHLSTSCFDGDSWSLRITHWMPLPEPPKEET